MGKNIFNGENFKHLGSYFQEILGDISQTEESEHLENLKTIGITSQKELDNIWLKIAGQDIADNTTVTIEKNKILTIKANSPIWGHLIRNKCVTLKQAFNQHHLPISDIRIKLAPRI